MINEMDIKYQKAMERKEGWKEGREEGFELGEMKGRKENKIEIATKMKQNKIPIETIAICTGLTIEEINSL